MKVRSVDVGRVWDCMLCACVIEEGGDGEGESSEAPCQLSYTLRYVSFAELGHVCQFGLREPIHLCACVIEEGGDGEGESSEVSSQLSYTLRYVSFAELGHVCQFGLREPMHLCCVHA
jgi:hypothetical protein